MSGRARRKVFRTRVFEGFNRVLKATLGTFLRIFFRLEASGEKIFRSLRPPYLIIPNHATSLDPFFVGYFVPRPVHWVTGDGNMRSSVMKLILSMVGSIPKAKGRPDVETIGMIMDVARKRRGVIGVFAEGQATWNGATLPLIESTGKLARLLKVPVVAAVLKGAYFSFPRWTWGMRRGRVRVEYRLAMTGEEAGKLPPEECLRRISAAIDHDECADQGKSPIAFLGAGRARHLELALFLCPACGSVGRMRSSGARFRCASCGASARMDRFGFLRSAHRSGFPFARIVDWDAWQGKAFAKTLFEASARGPDALMIDEGVRLYRGLKSDPLRRAGKGTLSLYADRLEFVPTEKNGRKKAFSYPIESIEGASVLIQQRFEFYSSSILNQFRFPSRAISGRKWLMAVEALAPTRAARA